MGFPAVGEPPWGFVEWLVTGLSTFAVSVAAFVWRLMARLERMSISIDHQREDFEIDKEASAEIFQRTSERLGQIHDDYFRLRETIGALPSRADLRDLEAHISERIDALAARFDRALETRGS